jgi:hypothetical protein
MNMTNNKSMKGVDNDHLSLSETIFTSLKGQCINLKDLFPYRCPPKHQVEHSHLLWKTPKMFSWPENPSYQNSIHPSEVCPGMIYFYKEIMS